MSDISAEIGFANDNRRLPPPPKSAACASGMKDHRTASSMPRVARARRALERRIWLTVRTFWEIGSIRGRVAVGTLSMPTMRITSSTKSAFPCTSGRQLGGETFTTSPLPATQKPSKERIALISLWDTSRPERRFTSLSGNSMMRSSCGTSPTTCRSDASPPPHRSVTSFVATSRPSTIYAGSTPRSKR